ncbi:MAG: hypothetical protein BGP06_20415 [Rhizobiales bacterium 65-9]|nr:GNAT family N-acetyltransferase [Hyphomicrobiales bacterium]OJY36407.1 MAG: hypothetical protein BGP06_20415 [Rhizobiales bacterium 65-9]
MSALLAHSPTIARASRDALRTETALSVRALTPAMLESCADALASLAERALARNVFYEAPFLLHAAHHLRDGGRPLMVTVWRADELVALFPIAAPGFSIGPRVARGWLSRYMTDGTPLIDMACAEPALEAFLDWADAPAQNFTGVSFPAIDVNGPFAALLRTVSQRRALAVARFGAFDRAALRPREQANVEFAPSAKKRRELQRQSKRLGETGSLVWRAATERRDVRDAFEHFLALEARGWKGRASSAMMQDAPAAAFARCAMRALASEGRCRIDLLELDGEPIAATIELLAGHKAYFWKIAYDETRARFSPGAQASMRLTERHQSAADLMLVDSCAEADHPMINRMWRERIRIADLFVATSSRRGSSVALAMRAETLRRGARAAAKSLYRAIRPVKAR